jgi:hypothetical protein
MSAVLRIRRHIDSDTLHVPELRELMGKDVEITVTEARPDQSPPDLSKLDEIAGKIDLDFDAIEKLREISKI